MFIAIEFEADRIVGPWKVRPEFFEGTGFHDAAEVPTDWLAKKAVPSMEYLMDGKIEYFIETPTWFDKNSNQFVPKPLIFCDFDKKDRPRAWKNGDLRIQTTLPLLGNDIVAANIMKDRKGNTCSDEEEQSNPLRLIRVSIELVN